MFLQATLVGSLPPPHFLKKSIYIYFQLNTREGWTCFGQNSKYFQSKKHIFFFPLQNIYQYMIEKKKKKRQEPAGYLWLK